MHLPIKKCSVSVHRNAEDADTGASGSSTAPTETNYGGSDSSLIEINNGASTSLTTSIGNYYDVFLNFRGVDTRKGFTDHLYNGLVDAGIHTFRDNNELREGKEIGLDLLTAIKNSKILIPILSVNYGSSNWCFNELVQIIECKNSDRGHIVLPIFYKVEPTHVRHQSGSFGDAFRTSERNSDQTILVKWKQALVEVSSLKGWDANGYEGQLVKKVVRKVLSELKKKFELDIPENLVGIDSHVEKIMEFVDNSSHATLFVGIHGMGGIGKTTLAKTIYNKLLNQFEYSSFIADIRESWKRIGVHCLQYQLINDILKQENQVCNKDEGIKILSSMLKGKKVLILLDDVDDYDQLKALAGNYNWFSSGSRIIITTRNKSILDNAQVNYNYEHEELDKEKSLILFSRHAFRKDSPPSEFEDLTHDVVSTTGGLPLSLEVLGSFLCGKEPKVWRGTIKKLRKVPHEKVQEKLRISYEALTHEQKQIFLDIASFFIRTNKIIASYMWDACDFFPEEGIEVLKSMSLIKVGNNHELRMHDQLRDLGREIIRGENHNGPQYRSRLWDSTEVLEVLKGNEGTEKIEAICLSSGETTDRGDNILTGKQFKKLRNLRFLDASGAHFSGDFENSTKKLKWLRWHNCPLTFEAKKFHVKELVVLELSRSKISNKWRGWSFIKMAEKLKFLDLAHCQSLEGTFFLSAFKNLEVLILKGCQSLKQIDSSIGNLKSLARLNLSGCIRLKELPAEVSKLEALERLLLRNCGHFSSLPDSIGALQNLEILDICGSGIKELPNGIGRLRKLQKLEVSRCQELQRLSKLPSNLTYLGITCQNRKMPSLSRLNNLKELHLLNCEFLESILELPLTLLDISECSQLKLEKSLNTPFKLEFLEILCCKSMDTLDVSQFSHLKTLSVQGCCNIREVRGLDKLKYLESMTIKGSIERFPKSKGMTKLDVEICKNLVENQDLKRLEFSKEPCITEGASIKMLDLPKSKYMKKLDVGNCKILVEIQGLDRLEFLEELCISKCALIERLKLPKSKGMKILDALYCENLVEIQDLNQLEFLEELCIVGCISIKRLDLPKSRGLKILNIENCKNLVEIQGLDKLEFLEKLFIVACSSIERLDLPKSRSLKKLGARCCENLAEIQDLDKLDFLEELCIVGCASIERLDLPKSKGLKKLNVRNCKNLVEIQGLNELEFLEKLSIVLCASIQRLDLSKSGGLKILAIVNCKNLVEIQGLSILGFLKRLYISGCFSIKRLDLPKSKGLKELHAKICENLVEIQGLHRLESLEKLYISKCTSIERVDLSKSKGLKILIAQNCNKLIEIQGLDRLEFLERLCISGCTSIKNLNLSKSKSLKILDAKNCENLVEIQGLNSWSVY